MKDPTYWIFIDRIVKVPVDFGQRLIFADWLEDNGMLNAARKQRNYAKIIQDAVLIVKYELFYDKIYGIIRVKKGFKQFEIKKDSRIRFFPGKFITKFQIERNFRNMYKVLLNKLNFRGK